MNLKIGIPLLQTIGASREFDASGSDRSDCAREDARDSSLRKLLIVDDDPATREVLFEIFTALGFEAQCAGDGKAALEALKEMKTLPSVILLDLVMPVMNGWEFRHAQLRDSGLALIPIIILSGTAILASDVSALQPAGFLRKPVAIEKLHELIRSLCS
jgi:CheY-like chemotaxis protein